MRVVLDTCIFYSDPHMSKGLFRVFLNGLSRTDHRLYVPRVVYDELINKHSERLREPIEQIRSAMGDLKRYTRPDEYEPLVTEAGLDAHLDDLVRDYTDFVVDRLAEADADFLDYPDVPHKQMVARVLDRKRPFCKTAKGYRGYRDAVIWESVLKLATNGELEPVGLISRDSDFAGPDDQLHPDLREDIDSLGDECCTIRLFRSLEGFNEEHIKPKLQELEQIRAQLQAGEYPGLRLDTFIEQELVFHVSRTELDPVSIGLPPDYETPSLSSVQEILGIDVLDVRQLSTDELLIDLLASISGEFDFVVFADYYQTRQSVTVDVDLKLILTFDIDAEHVTSTEIVQITRKLKPLTVAEQLREASEALARMREDVNKALRWSGQMGEDVSEALTRLAEWSEQMGEDVNKVLRWSGQMGDDVSEALTRLAEWSEQMKEVSEIWARFPQQSKAIEDADDNQGEDESGEPNESDDTQD